MDLGIGGKRALVCASSKGLGRGCAEALAAAGVHLVLNARGADALEATAAAIRAAHGVDVTTVAADVDHGGGAGGRARRGGPSRHPGHQRRAGRRRGCGRTGRGRTSSQRSTPTC